MDVAKVLFGQRWMRMCKKGISLSCSKSIVNLILSWRLFKYRRNSLAASLLSNMVKVSSTYLYQSDGRIWPFVTNLSSKWHMKMFAKTGPYGEPMATPSIWSQYWSSKRKWLFLVANSNNLCRAARGYVGGSGREYSFSRQICVVSSSGTFVNSEQTSKEHIIPLCWFGEIGWSIPTR